MVEKFRKKPVVVEAIQLTRNFAEVCLNFIDNADIGSFNLGEFAEDSCYIKIKTLEGVMTAEEGDWIIKGVNGEFYPCKPDIFEKTYGRVEENEISLEGITALSKEEIIQICRDNIVCMKLPGNNLYSFKLYFELVAENIINKLKKNEENFKEAFLDVMLSNYRLGRAEYNRNPAYNNAHYHYKAEEKMMYYLMDNCPELWKEISKKVLEIDKNETIKK